MGGDGGGPRSVRRTFPASAVELRHIRRWVREAASQCRVPAEEIEDLVLVASELAANAVEASRPGNKIGVELRYDDGTVLIVENAGRPFEPDDLAGLPHPSSERGRGLAIVKFLGHEIRSEHLEGFTRVIARRVAGSSMLGV